MRTLYMVVLSVLVLSLGTLSVNLIKEQSVTHSVFNILLTLGALHLFNSNKEIVS